jgi:hypothetical protein
MSEDDPKSLMHRRKPSPAYGIPNRDVADYPPSLCSNGGQGDSISLPEHRGRRKRRSVLPEQRKRVRRACQFCRRNKTKCDGQDPCLPCRNTNKDCQYLEEEILYVPQARLHMNAAERLHLLDSLFQELHPDIPTDLQSLRDRVRLLPEPSETSNFERERSKTCGLPAEETQNSGSDLSEKDSILLGETSKPPTSITVHNQGKTRRSEFINFPTLKLAHVKMQI